MLNTKRPPHSRAPLTGASPLITATAALAALGAAIALLAAGTSATARAQLSPGLRDLIPSQVLKSCVESDWHTQDPDQASPEHALPGATAGVASVLLHSGKSTNAESNLGARAYMADAVTANDEFFGQALRFYTRLKQLDSERPPSDGDLVKIEDSTALAIWPEALSAAHGDPYNALKILALFGHDNLNHDLDSAADKSDCRITALNYFDPLGDSLLYTPGALAGIGYSAAQISQGQQIGQNCWSDALTGAEKKLCNDLSPTYRADYYHVIAGAFFGCYGLIANAADGASKNPSPAASRWVGDKAYLALVKKYKTDRFAEEINHYDEARLPILPLLRRGLAQLKSGFGPLLPPLFAAKLMGYSERDYNAAKTILSRYEFEVDFRVAQHRLGLEFGERVCAGRTDFAPTSAP